MFKLVVLLVAVAAVWGIPHRGRFPLNKSQRSTPGGRIVGGHDADIADYPYSLVLAWNGIQSCGASLIASKWVLTAAYCTDYARADQLSVIVGSTDWRDGEEFQVAAVHQHPQFVSTDTDYDISVLELVENINVENAYPIALHEAGYFVGEGTDVNITGWGYLDADMNQPAGGLQVLVTKVISNELCNGPYLGRLNDRMMCTGNWEEGGEAACFQDWGDPVVVDGKQYGIVSYAHHCAVPQWPQINTRVSEESIRQFVRDVSGL